MEFQTMGRRRPLSRFMFRVAFLIWMASTVLLSHKSSAILRTVAPSQLNHPASVVIYSASTYLLTISLPDIDNVRSNEPLRHL